MNSFSGMIISDISDHFPIVLNLQFSNKHHNKSPQIKQNKIYNKTMFNLLEIKKKHTENS